MKVTASNAFLFVYTTCSYTKITSGQSQLFIAVSRLIERIIVDLLAPGKVLPYTGNIVIGYQSIFPLLALRSQCDPKICISKNFIEGCPLVFREIVDASSWMVRHLGLLMRAFCTPYSCWVLQRSYGGPKSR